MGRPTRATARRLTIRLIASAPGAFALLATICLVAVAAAVGAHAATLAAQERLATTAVRRYGWVRIVAPSGERTAAARPTLSHGSNPLPWFTEDDLNAIARNLSPLGLTLVPRIELAAFDEERGRAVDLIAVAPGDPGLAGAPTAQRAVAPQLTIAVRDSAGSLRWVAVPDEEVVAVDDDGTAWVRLPWVRATLGADPAPANVLVAAPTEGSPFSAAFDAAAALESGDAGATVLAWPELVGYEAYVGAGGSAGVLRPLVWIVAATAIAGSVTVAARNRLRDVVVLRTLGFDRGAIRGVFVREVTLASGAAVALVLASLALAGESVGIGVDLVIRRTLIGGVALPPVVAFLALRRELRIPLARARREAEL